MARGPMTLDDISVSRPEVDLVKIAATTEDDIRWHQIEDGEDPDASLPQFHSMLRPKPAGRA